MSRQGRPFDFESEARADFATGAVPAVGARRTPQPRRTPTARRPVDEADGPVDRFEDLRDADVAPIRDHHAEPVDDRYDDAHGHGERDDAYEAYDDYDEIDEPVSDEVRPARRRQHQADSAELIQRVIDVVTGARTLPLSTSATINRDEVLELLEEARDRLPDELREARWLRKEREEYLEKMRSDGDEIIAHARNRVEHMVQRTEIVKAAEHRARRTVEQAEAEARRQRLEVDDFCDQHLARFEIVLERTLKRASAGRAKLQQTGLRPPDAERGETP